MFPKSKLRETIIWSEFDSSTAFSVYQPFTGVTFVFKVGREKKLSESNKAISYRLTPKSFRKT